MRSLRAAMFDIVDTQKPMTVRQVFYRGVGFGLWDKTEADYKNVVCRVLADMRRDREIPYTWIADGTRWMRKPRTFSSLESALRNTAATYRRALWDHQDMYVEVWLEKEALAGVIVEATDPWDVPLMVTRGYPSLSFLHSASETIRAKARPRSTLSRAELGDLIDAGDTAAILRETGERLVRVLYLGDRDPSGDDIARNVAEQLEDMSDVAIEFVRVAVTAEQVETFGLPTRPTKRSDSRTRGWDGAGSVEVDAIEPDMLRELVGSEIEACIDQHDLDTVLVAEADEREIVRRIVAREFA
ncbi:MAG: hypothetical protein M3Q30_13500 [Actinomycetota bacterium]|nr:hypothetical protein [Actinomycetota bacterium]